MAFIDETIENIPNDSNFTSNAISAQSYVSNEDLEAYIAKIFKLQAKYKTPDEITIFKKHLNDLFIFYIKEKEKISNQMDQIFKTIKQKEEMKDTLQKIIDGTYECIKVTIKEPVEITVPINTFSDKDIHIMHNKGIITTEIFSSEVLLRHIIKKYQSNEDKISYINRLDDNILTNNQKIINYINKLFRINIIKHKINYIKNVLYNTNEIVTKYNLDISIFQSITATMEEPIVALMETPMDVIAPTLVEKSEVSEIKTSIPPPMTPPPALEYFQKKQVKLPNQAK